jgi:hypothetical protein
MICPLRKFLPLPEISAKVHPLRVRNRSSFSIANAFAKSSKASSKVHNRGFNISFSGTITASQYPIGDIDGNWRGQNLKNNKMINNQHTCLAKTRSKTIVILFGHD